MERWRNSDPLGHSPFCRQIINHERLWVLARSRAAAIWTDLVKNVKVQRSLQRNTGTHGVELHGRRLAEALPCASRSTGSNGSRHPARLQHLPVHQENEPGTELTFQVSEQNTTEGVRNALTGMRHWCYCQSPCCSWGGRRTASMGGWRATYVARDFMSQRSWIWSVPEHNRRAFHPDLILKKDEAPSYYNRRTDLKNILDCAMSKCLLWGRVALCYAARSV